MEALLQLMPRVNTTTRRYPPSGKWAIDAQTLLLLTDIIQDQEPRTVVEFGSGSSTVWIGQFVARYGGRVISIEHDPHYFEITNQLVRDHGLEHVVEVVLAELTEQPVAGETVSWYDPHFTRGLKDVDLMIVDGPPKVTGPAARRPALPMLAGALSDRCIILVDDCQRADEKDIVKDWVAAFPSFTVSNRYGTERACVLIRSSEDSV